MKSDFAPVVGHRFTLKSDHVVTDCQVRTVEEGRSPSDSWHAFGLESVLTWTLTPTATVNRLRMEQAGFRLDQAQAYGGARGGWARDSSEGRVG